MIDLELDEEQRMIQDTIGSFADERIRPAAHEADERSAIPDALVEQGWALGIVQGTVPETYGGYGQDGGASAITGTVIAEAMAEGDLAIALHLLSPRLIVDAVTQLGSEEQKKRLLPDYCGESFVAGSAALLEPAWDFDISDMSTRARREGEGWVIDGRKCYVTLADEAPRILVYARDEEDTIGAFLVEAEQEGLTIGAREKHMGIRALKTFAITLDSVRVDPGARLGRDAGVLVRRSRVAQSAMAVGVARASLDYAMAYSKEREAFGSKIAQKQAIAFMLAEMAIEVDATRLLNWEAAWCLDQGQEALRETAIARRYAADTVMTVADNGIQVLGGHGFVRDHPVELWARNGRGFAAFEGLASV